MFKHYIATALRNFRRHWVTTGVNVVGLGLGIACFITALSIVQYYRLDDAHYPGSERIYFVMTEYSAMGAPGAPVKVTGAPWVLGDYLRAQPRYDGVARATGPEGQSFGVSGNTVELRSSYADAEFLKLFPIPFTYGDRAAALTQPRTAVISDAAAQRIFGRHDVVGQRLLLGGMDSITIVGVTSPPPQPSHIGSATTSSAFRFDILVSMDMLRTVMERSGTPADTETSLHNWNNNAGRLVPLTYVRVADSAAGGINALSKTLAELSELHPNTANRRFVAYRIPELRAHRFENRVAGTGLSWASFLIAIASVVLLASCLNYANLSAAILLSHRKEIGVRRVIGASTRQLAMQSLVESAVLTAGACLIAVVLLLAANTSAQAVFDINLTYAWTHVGNIWAQALAAIVLVCFAVAAYPALLIRRSKMAAALRQTRSDTARNSAARWLVATQFLLASVLLIGILVVRSQHEALRRFALDSLPEPIITIDNNLQTASVSFETLRTELLRRPGITSVSGSSYSPWGQTYGLVPISGSLAAESSEFSVISLSVAQGYFKTMHIQRLSGQLFDDIGDAFRFTKDIRVVIDRATARRLGWSDPNDAIGKVIYPGPSLKQLRKAEVSLHVIGVVEDKASQFTGNGAVGTIYQRPMGQALTPVVRVSKSQLAEGLASIDSTWQQLAPNRVLHRAFLDERIERYIAERNFNVRVVAWITALAFLIAMSGLIGMSVHMANRRRHEIGVRKTLGARTVQVTLLLLRDFSKPVIVGNLFAWPLAYLATQAYLDQYTHRVGFSPLPFLYGLAATLLVAGFAVTWQAMSAARISPASVLRNE